MIEFAFLFDWLQITCLVKKHLWLRSLFLLLRLSIYFLLNVCFLKLKQILDLVQIEILVYCNIQLVFILKCLEFRWFKNDLYILCIYFDLSFQLIQTMLHTLILFVHLKWIYNLQLLNGLLNLEILVNTIIFILILLIENERLRLYRVIYFLNIL